MSAEGWAAIAGGLGVVVAATALIVAIIANGHAKDSAAAARDSADEAKRANAIAEEANTRTARAHRIATTPSHIAWKHTWHDDEDPVSRNVLSYQNTGTDKAHSVVINVDALDLAVPRATEKRTRVEPTDRFGINLDSWAREANGRWEQVMASTTNLIAIPSFDVRVTITWRTDLGVTNLHTEEITL